MKRSAAREGHTGHIVTALRQLLKQHGWTIARLARHFQAGEATIKRWLSGHALTLDRLVALTSLCNITVAELAGIAERPQLHPALTLAQERELSKDIWLSFLFIAILGGEDWQEIRDDFHVPQAEMDAALGRLDRLALIDRLPSGRVRATIDPAIMWRKSPMRTLFERQMKAQFVNMDFAADDAVYASQVMKLSAQGAAQLAELIEKHRLDVQALAARDREVARLPRQWYGMLCAARPMDTKGLAPRSDAA
jgi:transcriptional regulator with XRE-family HTH domain